jgi:hypothetical protein
MLPDGTSFTAFDQDIISGQEYSTTGTAGTPLGTRTLVLCVVSGGSCDQLATTSFDVIGGYTTYQPPSATTYQPPPPQASTVHLYSLPDSLRGKDPSALIGSDLGASILVSYVSNGQSQSTTESTPFTVQADVGSQITFSIASSPSGWQSNCKWDHYGYGQSSSCTLSILVQGNDKIVAFFTEGWEIVGADMGGYQLIVHIDPESVQQAAELSNLFPQNAFNILNQVWDQVNDPNQRMNNPLYQTAYNILNDVMGQQTGLSPDDFKQIYIGIAAWALYARAKLGLGLNSDGSLDFKWAPHVNVMIMSNADALLTDSQGRQVGSVYQNGQFVQDVNGIPGAFYSGHNSYPTYLSVPSTVVISSVTVIGVSTSSYHLVLDGIGVQGVFTGQYDGSVSQGESQTFTIPSQMSGSVNLQRNAAYQLSWFNTELAAVTSVAVILVLLVTVGLYAQRNKSKRTRGKFCLVCGRPLRPGAKFCLHDGTPVRKRR